MCAYTLTIGCIVYLDKEQMWLLPSNLHGHYIGQTSVQVEQGITIRQDTQ